jgi:hypothetical protein
MKATLMAPIESIRGKISKGYYARVLYGKQVLQRCPVRNKKTTAKQMVARQWFAENLAGRGWLDVANGNRLVSEESSGGTYTNSLPESSPKSNKPMTDAQKKQRERFRSVVKKVNEVMKNSAQREVLEMMYKKRGEKDTTLRGFVFRQINELYPK